MSLPNPLDLVRGASLCAALWIATPALPVAAQNFAPNPYQEPAADWAQSPPGREWGSTSAVFPARDGSGGIWVAERCGQNSCAETPELDPVILFDASGKVVRSFGKGQIVWPHGIHVDAENNVWIADARGAEGKGHQVLKFSPTGELLMALGKAGVAGRDESTFDQPNDVLVAPSGDIFVADGHPEDGNNRIVKFRSDGSFVKAWGETGSEPGQFRTPHALAMDSQGRLFVGDRGNRRVQIFDQEGEFQAMWYQFGRPSGIFIDENDIVYVADSESNARRNPGFARGIRIASAADGVVTGFIPDPEPNPDRRGTSAAEGVAVDAAGNLYGAEVGPRRLVKYLPKRATE